jgi:hypothetical protein
MIESVLVVVVVVIVTVVHWLGDLMSLMLWLVGRLTGIATKLVQLRNALIQLVEVLKELL